MAADTNGITPEIRRQTIDRLFAERCSCVICHGSDTRIFRERGVKDLYRLLKEEPGFLHGAFVADKVVGKGAAALLVLGGVEGVYADVISRPALDLLEKNAVGAGYGFCVPHIVNRTRTGRCPLETRCDGLQTPEECLAQIEDFIETIKRGE